MIIVDKKKKKSTSISNLNFKTITLNAIVVRENLNYIAKFGLPASITQHINLCLIFYNVYINNFTLAINLKLNLWIFNCFKCYQLRLTLVVHMILEVFQDEFQKWRYIKFSKRD